MFASCAFKVTARLHQTDGRTHGRSGGRRGSFVFGDNLAADGGGNPSDFGTFLNSHARRAGQRRTDRQTDRSLSSASPPSLTEGEQRREASKRGQEHFIRGSKT